ncbi:MAG: glyoxalase [Chloroflexota bacterium]|nr:glyoxalase [Chloroflexota bacterium]
MRIQHVSVSRPPDTNVAARAFYGDVMGLQEIPPPAALAEMNVIWYRLDRETELHLFVEAQQARSARHFCVACDDVEALKARLEAGGMTVEDTIPIAGRPRYMLRDPFDNLIEITTIEWDYLDKQ